jgi:hypothetical protein
MLVRTRCGSLPRFLALALALVPLWLLGSTLSAEPLRLVQEVDEEEGGGAPFPPEAGVQLGLRPDGRASLAWAKGSRVLPEAAHVTFDRDARGTPRVFALDASTGELLVLRLSAHHISSETRRLGELAGSDAGGLAVDDAGDRLFVLDAARGRILSIEGFLRGARRRTDEIALPANAPPLRGLARHPLSGHLFALAPATGELLEITPEGELAAVHQLPARARGASAIAIASSSDGTDDPARQSLFAAAVNEDGGTTFELALEPLQLAAVGTDLATLVQTVNMAAFSPPSPDPSGVELLGPNGPLLVSDAEVEEMSAYRGVNLYEVNLSGTLASTSDTTFFSDEPTGVALNPANGHLFFSDDTGTRSVYEVTPGADNRVNSGDTVRQIRFSSTIDTEGVAFGGGSLWIADGVNAEVRRISPGPNGIFENGGDDVLSSFDTAAAGLLDPEGIAYDTDGGNLYVAGEPENRIGHFSASGTLLRWLDISAGNPDNGAGVAYGPSPSGGPTRRLYLVQRGRDNGGDPNENDGKLFTYSVDPLGGGGGPTNQAPIVSAGNDLARDLAASASLDGTVSDDGLPSGTLTTSWSKVSGPGTVSFGNPNAIDTTATFSSVGTYVVRLTANDGQLAASDDATITVTSSGGGGTTTLEKRATASADDAEQGASGSVSLTSSDLEVVTDGTDVQSVGIRFGGLAIPPGAPIVSAWIQLQADETSDVATTLTIQGEASDNAAPFTSGSNNVGARPRTAASVGWSPPVWNLVGEAGAGQRTPDLSAVVQQIVSRGGWLSGNALAFVITGSGSRVAESFDGTATGAPLLHVVFGGAAGNVAPTVSAGPDRSISLAQAASLDGTVSDDGLPNGTLTTTWSRVSGPGTVGFANAGAVDTTATFGASGSYILRLTAFDGERSTQDEMAVSVIGNTAPSVSAGPDRVVTLGQAASLDGTVSDDGLPNGTLTTTWSRVSGPGTVGFASASAVDTTATFSAPGSYVLRLSASDGALGAQDDMAVSVLDPNAGGSVDRRISVGSDDAEQRLSNGAVAPTGSDLELVVDRTRVQLIGLRFPDLPIPAGATIQNAWIQLMADEVTIDPASITIQAEATANPATFTSTANDIGARPRSGAAVPWSPAPWNLVGEAGAAQRTPNLIPVIQAAVNQQGWNPGNAIVIILSGSGTRTAESFEGKTSGAALLHVEYGPGS